MSKERGVEGKKVARSSLLGCWRVTVGLDMSKSWRWKNGLAFSTQQLAHRPAGHPLGQALMGFRGRS